MHCKLCYKISEFGFSTVIGIVCVIILDSIRNLSDSQWQDRLAVENVEVCPHRVFYRRKTVLAI
jgi:hypothetical protein